MPAPDATVRCLALLLLVVSVGCRAQVPDPPPGDATPLADTRGPEFPTVPDRPLRSGVVYEDGPVSPDGTGRYYLGREIAKVMSHRGAAWLERPDRQEEERPELLIDALALRPADVVADLGAGTGYFTFRLAPLVPEGRVLAVDIQPEMLDIVEARAQADGVQNVVAVLGTESAPGLADETVDLTLIVDAYHEFSKPREMLAALYAATVPTGRLVLVEYRAEDADVPIRRLHKMTEAQVRLEVEAAGFDFVENLDVLPQQHVLIFERPADAGE